MQKKFKFTKKGTFVDKRDINPLCIKQIKSTLTAVPKVNPTIGKAPISFPVYNETANYLIVPKYYAIDSLGEDNLDFECFVPKESNKIDVKFQGQLREFQKEPYEKLIEKLKKEKSTVFQFDCGSGKTVLALKALAKLGYRTLFLVNKKFLLEQTKARAKEFIPGIRIGEIHGSTIDIADKDLVIGMVQSISMKDYDPAIFNNFDFTIFDEIHNMSSDVFSRVFFKTGSYYNLGLSATPERKDGLSKVFKWHLGGEVESFMRKYEGLPVLVNVITYSIESKWTKEELIEFPRERINFSKMLTNIASNKRRTALICKIIIDILKCEPDRNILVLSDRLTHIHTMDEILRSAGIDAGIYVGKKKQQDLEFATTKQVIIGLYQLCGEAFDVSKLNCLVLASPRSAIIQVVGRILRNQSQNKHPIIIDVIDDFSIYPNQAKKRIKYYKQKKYIIYEHQVDNLKTPIKIKLHE